MSWHIHNNMNFADSDGYGADTDNPPSAYEKLDEALKPRDERAIHESYNEWVEETAKEYFDTSRWGDDEWDAWRDIVNEQTY